MKTRVLTFAAFAIAAGCAPRGPEPIAYGTDMCAYCRMPISDRRFAAELMTVKGRTVKFDSIECLIAYYGPANAAHDVESVWVSDLRDPGALLDAATARFVNVGPGRTPMGRGLAAVASARDAAAIGVIDSDRIKRWSDIQ